MNSHSDRSRFDSNNRPPWECLRECASDARLRIAREIMNVHNVKRSPAPQDAALFVESDCGASGAASLSSLLDQVLSENASIVPSRKELVAQQQQRAVAAAKAVQMQLRPLDMHKRGRGLGAVTGSAVQGDTDALAPGQKRGVMPLISEDAEDKALEWDDHGGVSLQRHYGDRVSIKSRTHSRQGSVNNIMAPCCCRAWSPAARTCLLIRSLIRHRYHSH